MRAGEVSASVAARGPMPADGVRVPAGPLTRRRGPVRRGTTPSRLGGANDISPAFPTGMGARWPRAGTPSTRSPMRPQTRLSSTRQAGTRRGRGPSVASVKQPTVRTDRSRARIPSAIRPWTQRPAARQGDTRWDREETARVAENSQLAGRFSRWWQVLGSNQRGLSRRFYRPLVLVRQHAA